MPENNIWGEIAKLIGCSALDAVDRTQPMSFVFGTVTSTNPLKIATDQKMTLTDEFLILTNAVRDHSVDISVSWTTGEPEKGNTDPTGEHTHNHKIQGRKKITIHNSLTLGEKVLLLRAQGGQDYIVIDRVDEIPTTGESV